MKSLEEVSSTKETLSMDDTQVESNSINGPGLILRTARERLNLNLVQVAAKMHLSPRIIQALEADNYEMIANFTFVRGYLRAYARVLNLSGDELVQAFNQLQLTEKSSDCVRVEFSQRHTPTTKNRRVLYLITGLIVLLLLVLMVIWRQHQSQLSKKPSLFSQQLQHVPVVTKPMHIVITKMKKQPKVTKIVSSNVLPSVKAITQPKDVPKKPVKLLTPFAS